MTLSQLPEIIDPHMHMWDLAKHYYSWLQDEPLPNNPAGDMEPIAHRSYLLDDYLRDTEGWNITAVVHIECGLPPQSHVSETQWLQKMADVRGFPQGVVAGADLRYSELEDLLATQAAFTNVRGIRQIGNWHAAPYKTYNSVDPLLDPAWRRGFGLLEKYDLAFDLQIYPSQMGAAAELAARHPATQVILNHAGMPTDRDEAGLKQWRDGLVLLAGMPNVAVKISGLAMCDRNWTTESFRPFVLHSIDLFGIDRCMFASNFPVESIYGAFDKLYGTYSDITSDFTPAQRAALFADNARRIYRLVPGLRC